MTPLRLYRYIWKITSWERQTLLEIFQFSCFHDLIVFIYMYFIFCSVLGVMWDLWGVLLSVIIHRGSPPSTQKMEDKLEEVLREFKSLRDRVILQDRRIARLEEQVAKVALWRGRGRSTSSEDSAWSSWASPPPRVEAQPTFQNKTPPNLITLRSSTSSHSSFCH